MDPRKRRARPTVPVIGKLQADGVVEMMRRPAHRRPLAMAGIGLALAALAICATIDAAHPGKARTLAVWMAYQEASHQ